MTRFFAITAVLLSLVLVASNQDASRAAEAQRPEHDASKTFPRIELRVAKTTYDTATGTLTLVGVGRVDVYDAAGKIHTTNYQELAALSGHPASHKKTQEGGVLTISGEVNGEAYKHEVESFSHDLESQSMSLKLSSGAQLKTIRSHPDATTVVLGPVPTHIACCDCDWKCSIPWGLVGYCSTCTSGTAGASTCCQVCGIPAAPGGTCP